ncbi:hypothetical protein ACHAXR_000686, partial [Thalassiosira sp. AJA248-18]
MSWTITLSSPRYSARVIVAASANASTAPLAPRGRPTLASRLASPRLTNSIICTEVNLFTEMNHRHRSIINMVGCYEDAGCVQPSISSPRSIPAASFSIRRSSTIPPKVGATLRAEDRGHCQVIARGSGLPPHENNIVHRDIKPDNILFECSDEKDIKLIYFGLSRKHTKGWSWVPHP